MTTTTEPVLVTQPGSREQGSSRRELPPAGAVTVLPRWSDQPGGCVAQLDVELPAGLCHALEHLAHGTGTTLASAVLAAHGRVLSALTGEAETTTGLRLGLGRPPLPCRLSSSGATWRDLLAAAHRSVAALSSPPGTAEQDLDWLQREVAVSGPQSEVLLALAPDDEDLPQGTVLALDLRERTSGVLLRLRHRTDALDEEAAERIAGYHLTALRLMAEEPDAAHAGSSLLSQEERDLQLDGLAGPDRPLPDRRLHQLIEEQVGIRPDDVAAVCGDDRLTYRELHERADGVAAALLAHGLRREDVVAVVTERNLGWMTAVLAILKAGGAYLPLEPRFPAERIATTLRRSGCRLVLTERGSTATLEEALTDLGPVQMLDVDAAATDRGFAGGPHVADSPVQVDADQLAYLYFTSGSTGEPKGAMCEHAGMLNHVLAKVEDLGIGEGTVVAQTAPQCFDISLWQLVSALLVGGRTLVVPQEVVLDVPRFVDTVVEGRVGVLQLVPSYLEAVLTYLEGSRRELPDLRCVSVTGEALKPELAQRWFALCPGIALVNAYGLTETSDDTNHEVMSGPPAGDRVPLGRPIRNVRVYVVDEQLQPVPLGAPGEIVFSGVCVGRGYINDPERTSLAYRPDPHRDGARLYRSGDFGRWLPGGTLGFLGRRDGQVKISGFRIEIGEVENTLLRQPSVRDAAVVVAQQPDGGRQLIGFYTSPRPLDPEDLRQALAASLPAYMVPRTLHWQDALPLTPNGKIDRLALTARAGELGGPDIDVDAPRTPAEERLASAWATVLGMPVGEVGRHDHFFDRGGTSLSAVKLAVALNRAVTHRDVVQHPVLSDLAVLLSAQTREDPTR